MREPHVSPSDQVLFVGMNGSGKSELAKHEFHKAQSQKVVINVKRDPKLTRMVRAYYNPDEFDEQHEPVVGNPGKLDWSRPVLEYIPADCWSTDETDELYRELAARRNLCVLLDECYGPTTSNKVPKGLGTYLQHGRASNLRHLGCTQRPVMISKPLLTEASHIVVFPFGLNFDDRAYVAKNMGMTGNQFDDLVGTLDEARYGEYAHLWYEKRARTIHRRPSLRLRPT